MKKTIAILSLVSIILPATAFSYNAKTINKLEVQLKRATENFEKGTATNMDILEATAALSEMRFRMETNFMKRKNMCSQVQADIQSELDAVNLRYKLGLSISKDVIEVIKRQGLIDNECEVLSKLAN